MPVARVTVADGTRDRLLLVVETFREGRVQKLHDGDIGDLNGGDKGARFAGEAGRSARRRRQSVASAAEASEAPTPAPTAATARNGTGGRGTGPIGSSTARRRSRRCCSPTWRCWPPSGSGRAADARRPSAIEQTDSRRRAGARRSRAGEPGRPRGEPAADARRDRGPPWSELPPVQAACGGTRLLCCGRRFEHGRRVRCRSEAPASASSS